MPIQQTFGASLPNVGVILNAVSASTAPDIERIKLKYGQVPEATQVLVDAILEHTSTNSLEEAAEHLKRKVSLRPEDPEPHLELAVVHGLVGNWNDSAAAGERAFDLYSRQPDGQRIIAAIVATLFIAGFAYASMGSLREEGEDARKVELAEESFSKAIDLMPDLADSNYYLGALYRDLGRWEEAEQYFRKTLEIDPEYAMAHSDLGWIYLQRRQTGAALEAFKKAVQADQTNIIALKNLAEIHVGLRHWDEAVEVLRQRVNLYPNDADAYSRLSGIYLEVDEINKAEDAAKQTLRIDPHNAQAYFNLGQVYYNNDRLPDAQKEFRKVLSLDSGSLLALQAQQRLWVITAELQKKERENEEGTSEELKPSGYEHIAIDRNGVPVITAANMKVIELVNEKDAYGWSPEQMLLEHPHLTLGQIHSALAYYADHEDELDEDIRRRLDEIESLREASGPSPLRARLESQGLI